MQGCGSEFLFALKGLFKNMIINYKQQFQLEMKGNSRSPIMDFIRFVHEAIIIRKHVL